MKKPFDLAVVIGRFQPFHIAHHNLVAKALEQAEKVLICLGSCDIARNIKNPFSATERSEMILQSFPEHFPDTIHIERIRDQMYNDTLWVKSIQTAVDKHLPFFGAEVVLVGHKKDSSTWYLDMFPAYEYIDVDQETPDLNATTIRNQFFGGNKTIPNDLLSEPVAKYLANWRSHVPGYYNALCDEMSMITQYKKQWEVAPFQPVFVTTDAVVICSGHILLVKRRSAPGKGLWALPGGFLNPSEFIKDGMLRELEEETRIKVDRRALHAGIKSSRVFDHPNRSDRGRTITHAFLINLGWGPLPRVRGSDDAERAKWFPINTLYNKMSDQLFEDHWDIATTLITS